MDRKILILLVAFLVGCSASAPETVSLPVPFAGALRSDSRVVIIDGDSLGSGNPTSFEGTDGNNNKVTCDYFQNPVPVESTDLVPPASGRRDHYNMFVRCTFDDGDVVSAEVEVFDFPHTDATIDTPSFCPQGESCELRAGISSGIIQSGSGDFLDAPGNGLMTGKYVEISNLADGKKNHVHPIKWVWSIDGGGDGTAQTRNAGDLGIILPTLFENQTPPFHTPNGFGWALYEQGDTVNPAGFVEFNINPDPPPMISQEFIHLFLDFHVFKGDDCECDFETQTTQQCHDDPDTPFNCKNISSATFRNVEKFFHSIPEIFSSFTDGIPFSVSGTHHNPVDCAADMTGDYLTECLAAQETGRTMQLDYRCQLIVIFDENSNFVDLSRSLGGFFVISIQE